MHSIPQAMTWEFWRKGSWSFLLAWVGTLWLPTMIYASMLFTALKRPDLREGGFFYLYFACLLMQALAFSAAMLGSQESITRFYAWPISTSTIVTWRLIPGMAAMVLLNLATTICINLMFDVGWPLVGPALFMACIYPVFQAAIWLGEKAPLIQVILTSAAAVVFGAWLRAQHGNWFRGETPHLWTEVTTGQVFTLITMALLGWCGAYAGLRRDRCGESLWWLRLSDWVESWSFKGKSSAKPYRSPAWAQFWFEWRQKGVLMPLITIVGLSSMCVVILIRRALIGQTVSDDFALGIVLTGGLLPAVGLLVGMVLGQSGGGRDKTVMGSFLASRPVDDEALSRTTLIVTALSVLLAWAIWAVFAAVVHSLSDTAAMTSASRQLEQQFWPHLLWPLPFTWLAAASAACVVQTGRVRLMSQIFAASFLLLVGWLFLTGPVWKLGPGAAEASIVLFGMGALLFTVAAFIRAFMLRLISARVGWLSLLVWIVACIALESYLRGFSDTTNRGDSHPVLSIISYGLLALAVAPLATGPLAVAWNRHR